MGRKRKTEEIGEQNIKSQEQLEQSIQKESQRLSKKEYDKLPTKKKIELFLKEKNIRNYEIVKGDYEYEYFINVYGSVNLCTKIQDKLPDFIKFDTIYKANKHPNFNLKSFKLLDAMRPIFDISWCELTTLKGCPRVVEGTFNCAHNKLSKLDYLPSLIEVELRCYENTKKYCKEDIEDRCTAGFYTTGCEDIELYRKSMFHIPKRKRGQEQFVFDPFSE